MGGPGNLLSYPSLKPGDNVALISPASYPDQAWVAESVRILESWNLRVLIGDHVLDEFGFMAGTDPDRLSDLNAALRDPWVRAVITTRGGAGAYRIADAIDFPAARADPKPVVGFSDITYLHLSLWGQARVPGIHGCLAGSTATRTLRQLLMADDPLVVRADERAVSAQVGVDGVARGVVVGGNLGCVATSVGVRLPDLAGCILFLEDIKTRGLGLIDRQLTQLVRSGCLDHLAGIVLGSFEGFREVEDRGWTIREVLQDRLEGLGVPLLGGIPAGHDLFGDDGGPDQSCLPLGAVAELDTGTGTLVFPGD